jgi:hypothetical protein
MPLVSVVIVRTALLWLGLGTMLGGAMLVSKGLAVLPMLLGWRWVHMHVLLLGWMVQLACGVAIWILPRIPARSWRNSVQLIWLGYAALNIGVISALIASTLAMFGHSSWLDLLSWGCYGVAAVAWVLQLWPRLVPSLRETANATRNDS